MTTLKEVIEQKLYIPFGDMAYSPLTTDEELCREIQEIIKNLNYYPYNVDGVYGKVTREALREFKEENGLTGGDLLGPTTAEFLLKQAQDHVLPSPFEPRRDNLAFAVINECKRRGLTLMTQVAFVMATIQHETANTYRPIREFGGSSRPYAPYYGRGYIQLTHRYNYQKYSNILGIDLVNNPDRALEPRIALFITVHGMATGTFTGRRLGQYINVNRTDFYNARRMIGGLDRGHHVANLAQQWLSRLSILDCEPEVITETANMEFIDQTTKLPEEDLLMLKQVMSS